MGTPSLRIRKKFVCRMRTNPDALVLRVSDLGEREALLQGQPDAFFTTPHYDGYPYVLVRLEAVDPDELAELIEEAWRMGAPQKPGRPVPAGRAQQPSGRAPVLRPRLGAVERLASSLALPGDGLPARPARPDRVSIRLAPCRGASPIESTSPIGTAPAKLLDPTPDLESDRRADLQ